MKLSEFDYYIPKDQIAQYPLTERDTSRLFVLHREMDRFEHRLFRDVVEYLRPGDVLVLNDAKVIPARLYGKKPSGGRVEILLLQEISKNTWKALIKGIKEGPVILDQETVVSVSPVNGFAEVRLKRPGLNNTGIKDLLRRIGEMPLPPYIKRKADSTDRQHYQTVYAKKEGAIAAPTAGLHFTERLLDTIKRRGVEIKTLTLYVGYGTFKPVSVEEIEKHRMDEEHYEIPEETAEAINRAKAEGRRIIAVGTTVTRALEASTGDGGRDWVKAGTGEASIFIYPGYRFRVIDALITNLHQPKSTPMMLVAALVGLERLKAAYEETQKAGYRFFSYGDAMMII